MKTIHIYSDESRHKNERFLLLGGLWIEEKKIKPAELVIADLRHKHGYKNSLNQHVVFLGELKWTKVSDRYLNVYKEIVDIVFGWIDKGIARFNVMLVDTQNPIVVDYGNIHKEGYFKFLYQLYFHNSKIPAFYKIYPDSITNPTQDNVDFAVLKNCLDVELGKRFSGLLNPAKAPADGKFIRSIIPVNSKLNSLIQVVDVILGAIGYLQNGLFKRAEAKQAKVDLMKYIFEKIALSGGIRVEGKKYYVAKSNRFNIWLFRPNKKSPQEIY